MKRTLLSIVCFASILLVNLGFAPFPTTVKPTLCVLGGTPSTKDIINLLPDSIRLNYNVISFNRPGFGGTKNDKLTKDKLYKLASEAGLKKSDFGIIGISGGAPMAILFASEFRLKHCGIVSGMVSKQSYFKHSEKAVTKGIMETALKGYTDFEASVLKFPNVEEIVKQAGAPTKEVALLACYDEFNFILSDNLFSSSKQNQIKIDWWHGIQDVNVPIEGVDEFLLNFPNARLNKIDQASHDIDANVYISKLLNVWK